MSQDGVCRLRYSLLSCSAPCSWRLAGLFGLGQARTCCSRCSKKSANSSVEARCSQPCAVFYYVCVCSEAECWCRCYLLALSCLLEASRILDPHCWSWPTSWHFSFWYLCLPGRSIHSMWTYSALSSILFHYGTISYAVWRALLRWLWNGVFVWLMAGWAMHFPEPGWRCALSNFLAIQLNDFVLDASSVGDFRHSPILLWSQIQLD